MLDIFVRGREIVCKLFGTTLPDKLLNNIGAYYDGSNFRFVDIQSLWNIRYKFSKALAYIGNILFSVILSATHSLDTIQKYIKHILNRDLKVLLIAIVPYPISE